MPKNFFSNSNDEIYVVASAIDLENTDLFYPHYLYKFKNNNGVLELVNEQMMYDKQQPDKMDFLCQTLLLEDKLVIVTAGYRDLPTLQKIPGNTVYLLDLNTNEKTALEAFYGGIMFTYALDEQSIAMYHPPSSSGVMGLSVLDTESLSMQYIDLEQMISLEDYTDGDFKDIKKIDDKRMLILFSNEMAVYSMKEQQVLLECRLITLQEQLSAFTFPAGLSNIVRLFYDRQ